MRAWTVLLALLPPLAAGAQPAARWHMEAPASGFIDDAFALRGDGGALAYVVTDGAQHATLHIADLGGADRAVPDVPVGVIDLIWSGPQRVVLVWRDAAGHVSARSYSADGKSSAPLGPFEMVSACTVDKQAALCTYARNDKARTAEHLVAAYHLDTLKPLAHRAWREDKEGRLPGGLKPLWWERGLSALVVRKAGDYDKARDMQRPDHLARLDVFGGKLRDESEIGDLLAFVHINAVHAAHPGQPLIAYVSDDRAHVQLVDGDAEHEVKLTRPLADYLPETLRMQPIDDARVMVSITSDPMKPAALARKKADPEELDLFDVDRKTQAARLLLRLDTKGRATTWATGGGRLALLHKSKGFDRGGVSLEVLDLPR